MLRSGRLIRTHQFSQTQWIVSIGMISEGTDIPRLFVCCHITTIRTELYFRQVLGRVLRLRVQDQSSEGYLFTFAEPQLKCFSNRIQSELPHLDVLLKLKPIPQSSPLTETSTETSAIAVNRGNSSFAFGEQSHTQSSRTPDKTADICWSFRGAFREEIIRAMSQI